MSRIDPYKDQKIFAARAASALIVALALALALAGTGCSPSPSSASEGDVDSSSGRDGVAPRAELGAPPPSPNVQLVNSTAGRVTPGLPREPDAFLVPTPGRIPAAASYTRVAIVPQKLASPVLFNGEAREQVYDVFATGLEIVLDPADPDSKFAAVFDAATTQTVTLEAERVIVRGLVHLPQTDVTIFARELIFEDVDPRQRAMIVTTPLPFTTGAAPTNGKKAGQDGLDGAKGGDLALYVGSIAADGDGPRFDLSGGRGQAGGAGKKGTNGRTVKSETTYGVSRVTHTTYKHYIIATNTWYHPKGRADRKNLTSTSGGRAIAGGKPGDGGPSGALLSMIPEADKMAVLEGGHPGDPTPEYAGGRAGTPRKWHHIKVEVWGLEFKNPKTTVIDSGNTSHGKKAAARTGDPGQPGTFEPFEASPSTWLRATTAEIATRYARDAFLAGHTDLTWEITKRYIDALADAYVLEPHEEHSFNRAEREFVRIHQRLIHGFDYFGNPPGWVPMLSLEANYATFEGEIESSVRMLYLSHLIGEVWADQEQRRAMIDWMSEQLRDEMDAALAEFENTQALLPELRLELEHVNNDTETYLRDLKAVEKQIIEQFGRDEEGRRVGRAFVDALTAACTVGAFVVGGPGLAAAAVVGVGAVGSGVQSHMDGQTALPADGAISMVFERVLDEAELEEAREKFTQLDPGQAADTGEFLRQVEELSETLSKATRHMIEDLVANNLATVGNSAEFQKLLDENDLYQEMFDKLVVLLTRRQMFTEKVAEAMYRMENAQSVMVEASFALDRLTSAKASLTLDLDTVGAIQGMAARARERLVRYQYYLIKSHEYRMIEAASIDLTANHVFDNIVQLFGLNGGKKVPPAELASDSVDVDLAAKLAQQSALPPFGAESPLVDYLKLVYVDNLKQIVSDTIRALNENRPDPVSSVATLILTKPELDYLNEHGVLTVVLDRRVVFESDVNARIESVSLVEDKTKISYGVNPESGHVGNLELTIEPSRQTTLSWNGRSFGFVYGSAAEASLVRWGSSWNSQTQRFSHFSPTDDARSLLAQLVDPEFGRQGARQRIRFRPGARSRLVLRKEFTSTAPDADLTVDALALELELHKNKDFRKRASN